MSPMLQPTRFQLSETQLAAALALAGIQPSGRSMLPESSRVGQPASELQGTAILAEGGQRLTAEADATLRVVADPARILSVVANRAGRPVWVDSVFLHGEEEGPFASKAESNGTFDFALLPTATQAAILVDEMLGLTALVSQPGDEPITLGLSGYAAVLAAADALQAARLDARRSRTRSPMPVFTPELLEQQLNEGLAGTDTRWAVTAGRMVCPSDLGYALGRMAEGLAALQSVGLMTSAPGGYTLTQAGYTLATCLSQIVNTGSLGLGLVTDDQRVVVSQASVFRTAIAIWVGAWTSAGTDDATVRLFEVDAAGVLSLVLGLLEPVALPPLPPPPASRAPAARPTRVRTAPRPRSAAATPAQATNVCPSCQAQNRPGAPFCNSCGGALRQPAAPPPPTAAPAQAPSTMACPSCGMQNRAGAGFCASCGTTLR